MIIKEKLIILEEYNSMVIMLVTKMVVEVINLKVMD